MFARSGGGVCMENDEITQGERQEIAQWDRMFSKGKEGGGEREVGAERTELNLSQDRAFFFSFFLLRGLAKPLKSCESWRYLWMKLHPLVKLFHMMKHVAHGAKKTKKTHGPHEAVCTHISRKKGERRKQTEIRGRRREQMLKQMQEGALR